MVSPTRGPLRGAWRSAAALALLLALTAHADAQQGDDPRAQALFLEGRAAMERGDFRAACARFDESLTIVSRASTLLNLAQCEQHEGRLLNASKHWRQGIALLPPADERLPISLERAAALDARLPRLRVQLSGPLPAGSRLTLDGADVGPDDLARGLAQDPGRHLLILTAPGQPDRRTTVDLAEKVTRTLTLRVASTSADTAPRDGSGLRTAAFLTGGVGVAGLVLGGVMGALTLVKKGTVDQRCGIGGDPGACDHEGKLAADGMKTFGTAGLVGLGVGVAGLGAAAALLLAAPSTSRTKPGEARRPCIDLTIGQASAALSLQGRW